MTFVSCFLYDVLLILELANFRPHAARAWPLLRQDVPKLPVSLLLSLCRILQNIHN